MNAHSPKGDEETRMYVTAVLGGQSCGIPVLDVRDVLAPHKITPIPLARREVAGSLNLRGRIVTAFDLRVRMGLPVDKPAEACMSIVVEHAGELYSLIVDEIGDVLRVSGNSIEPNPPTLDPEWRRVSTGVCRLDGGLLIVFDVDALLDLSNERHAA